jgi:hypothetical protein
MSNRLCHQARVPALWSENGAGLRIIQRLLGHAASNVIPLRHQSKNKFEVPSCFIGSMGWLGNSLKPQPFTEVVASQFINWQPDKTLESHFDHVRSRKVTGWSL